MVTHTDSEKRAREVARQLLKIKAVTFSFDPPYTYTSGIKSPMYLDNRLVLSYPAVRRNIVRAYMDVIESEIGLRHVDYISGTASAAIPQASWIAGSLELPMVYVRPSSKKYGKGNKVEGYLKKGSKVVIIEDHISTAGSVVNNAEAIRELGGVVKHCVAATTYETDTSKKALEKVGITLHALTTGKVIVEEAVRKGVISSEQEVQIDAWFADPEGWGRP